MSIIVIEVELSEIFTTLLKIIKIKKRKLVIVAVRQFLDFEIELKGFLAKYSYKRRIKYIEQKHVDIKGPF